MPKQMKSPPAPKLLITGSRGMGNYGKEMAAEWTEQAIRFGAYIIVGEAEDVDETVIRVANSYAYKDIQVVGGYNRMRRRTEYGENVAFNGAYPVRDRFMAFHCTHCIGFWDGRSHGTIITVKAAAYYHRRIRVARITGDLHQWLKWEDTRGLVPLK